MLQHRSLRLAVALVFLLGVAASLPAQTHFMEFGFGENDGLDAGDDGSTLTQPGVTTLALYTLDVSGSNTATYTAATPFSTGSTIAAHFLGSSSYTAAPLFADGSFSFGLQLWVRPDNISQSAGIAYDGYTNTTGLGILQVQDHFVLSLGGVGTYSPAPENTFLPNRWTHLAVVYEADTHTTSLYQDGSVVASTTDAFIPVGVDDGDGDLSFGASYTNVSSVLTPSYFTGSLDSADFFLFDDGTFNAGTMLTYTPDANAVPEPATCSLLLALGAFATVAFRRSRQRC